MTRDPWRYRCPDCDCTTVRGRHGGFGHERARGRYYCVGCNTNHDQLRDVKTDELVGPSKVTL